MMRYVPGTENRYSHQRDVTIVRWRKPLEPIVGTRDCLQGQGTRRPYIGEAFFPVIPFLRTGCQLSSSRKNRGGGWKHATGVRKVKGLIPAAKSGINKERLREEENTEDACGVF